MNRHPIQFDNLVDWLDGRLDAEAQQKLEAHLAAGCPICQKELAWLRRVIEAARTDETVEPPVEWVTRVKALYRSKILRPAEPRRLRFSWAPRLALAAMLVLVVGSVFYMSQIPTLLSGEATLTALQGSVEAQRIGDVQWQRLSQGSHLREGDQARVTDGIAVLTLFDGSILEMQPGTELAFSSLRSSLFEATYQIVVNQQAGSVDYDVAPLRSSLSTFEVQSPAALVMVQGTRFVLTIESAMKTKVAVLEGSVQVVNAVTNTVLAEREVAIVPVNAAPIYLPTLTPVPTPLATVTAMPQMTPMSIPTQPPAVITQPTAVLEPTQTPEPSETPEPSKTPEAEETPQATTPPLLAATMRPRKVEFSGTIERFPQYLLGLWWIGGQMTLVRPGTQIIGKPELGLQAKVTALEFARQPLVALKIEVHEEPQPAPTVSPSSTLSPAPTHTPQPVETVKPWHTPRPTHTPWLTRKPHLTESPKPTMTPQLTDTPQSVQTMKPWRTPHPTQTPRPTRNPHPTESSEQSMTLEPTKSPGPTMMPEPTATLELQR